MSNWIKSTDELPEIGQKVLVHGSWFLNDSTITVGVYRGRGVWNTLPMLSEITHWQLLPQPPKF